MSVLLFPYPVLTWRTLLHSRYFSHRHNPDLPAGKCIVVGTQEGVFAKASRILDRKVEREEGHDDSSGNIICPSPHKPFGPSFKVLIFTTTSHSGEVSGPMEFPLEEEALLQGRLR